jgi:sugar phosphate isomerase/epimerase
MQFGVCWAAGKAGELASANPDFVEENIQGFLKPEAPDAEFAANLALARSAPFPILAANCFLPGSLKCVGPDVDTPRLLKYGRTAFARAAQVGMKIIVFGSGGARKVPDGFDHARAAAQFVDLLKQLGPMAGEYGVTVVVEPLNKAECNFVTSVLEGADVVRQCAHPNVRLLADIFHMLRDDEPAANILKVGDLLRHTHIAEKAERTAPGAKGDDFTPYLKALQQVGYNGGMAIECRWQDPVNEPARAFAALRNQASAAGLC